MTHSSILAWKMLWTEESVGLQELDMTEQLHMLTDVPGGKLTTCLVHFKPVCSISFYLHRFSSTLIYSIPFHSTVVQQMPA